MAKWKAIADAGALDDAVAMFEQFARRASESAAAQVELGSAYLQKVFKPATDPKPACGRRRPTRPSTPARRRRPQLRTRASRKPSALSFWPPVFGKQTEAINHFEILAAQQAHASRRNPSSRRLAPARQHVPAARQEATSARDLAEGAGAVPGNASLEQQIANAQTH
jgi:hypothetical protein